MADVPLTIKVMRLYAPTLSRPSVPVAAAPSSEDLVHAPTAACPPMIMLPEGFGAIYVGQRFSSYVTALNHSAHAVHAVKLSAELVLEGGKKTQLLDKRRAAGMPPVECAVLRPGESTDMVIDQLLSSTGAHTLKVIVSHSEYSGIPGTAPVPGKDIQKFYKFAIVDPFGFNYRPVFVSTGSEQAPLQLLVEVELSNTSPHSLCMSGVQFEPAPGYEATLITRKQADEAVIAIVDPLDVDACMAAKPLLSPGASFTAVFAVSPLLAQPWPSQAALEIGRVSTAYTMQLGEMGFWTSQPLVARTPLCAPLVVSWESVPQQMQVDTIEKVTLLMRNTTAVLLPPVQLQYSQRESGIVLQGLTTQTIGPFPADSTTSVELTLLALKPGWHTLDLLSVHTLPTEDSPATTISEATQALAAACVLVTY